MNKKYNHRQIIDTDNSEISEESQRLLHNIHNKLDNSPALNGGFDKLLYIIDGIEKSQTQIVETIDKIHEAIYHPDDGLFSRIAYNKATHVESMIKVEKHVHVLNDWKTSTELSDKTSEKEIENLQLKLQKVETNIENIQKLQSLVLASGKWLTVAIGGGLITAAFRVFFNGIKMLP